MRQDLNEKRFEYLLDDVDRKGDERTPNGIDLARSGL